MTKKEDFIDICLKTVLFVLVSLLLFSCRTTTQTQSGSIQGYVSLLSREFTLAAGEAVVSVLLYDASASDWTIPSVVSVYPSGAFIDYMATFDHRRGRPRFTTTPDDSGYFLFDQIPVGIYHLVVVKEGWGIKAVYNVKVEDEKTTDVGLCELIQVVPIPQFIEGDFTMEHDTTYLLEYDTSIFGDLVINSGVVVLVGAGKTLRLYGSISCPSTGFARIDSSDSVYQFEQIEDISKFNGLVLYGNSVNMHNLAIVNSTNAVSTNSQELWLDKVIISSFTSGVSTNQTNLTISNSIFENGSGIALQALSMNNDLTIQCSVFNKVNNSVSAYTGGETSIVNCYFISNEIAIRAESSHGDIKNCEFDMNRQDIYMTRSYFDVEYNNFHHSSYISIYPGSIGVEHQSTVNYNNFYDTDNYFIHIAAGAPSYTCVIRDFDATNNYWKPQAVDQYLFDSNDDNAPYLPCPFSIQYLPMRSSAIPTAGISYRSLL